MHYQVFDNGMPADTSPEGAGSRMRKRIGWDNSKFSTKLEAYQYAFEWLGSMYQPAGFAAIEACEYDLFGIPHKYSAYGDTIEVRKVE